MLWGFEAFVRKRRLAVDREVPYLVRWVGSFLAFADERRGRPFEEVLLAWLEGLREAGRHTDWQIRQAADAVSIYRHQFRRAGERTADGVSGPREGSGAKGTVAHHVSAEMETALKLRHYSARTVDCYLAWVQRFYAYRRETGLDGPPTAADVKAYLTHLAMARRISASTQNQAFNALLFLCRNVLHTDLEEMDKTVRARRGRRLPTVLSVAEVQALLVAVAPEHRVMAKLLYGSGLRLMELLRLRVKDLDFDTGLVFVRSGKGDKDRTTLLPESLHEDLVAHLAKVRQWHEADLARGYGEAPLPDALAPDELLGHNSVETTMVYTHVVRDLKTKARSPLDNL